MHNRRPHGPNMDSDDGGRVMMDPVTEQKEWIKAGAHVCMMEGHQIKMYEGKNIARRRRS